MKSLVISLFAAILMAGPRAHGLFPLLDHIDISPNYQPTTSTWTWLLITDFEEVDPTLVYMPARDAGYPDGEREIRPPGEIWDFTGVAPDEPLWIYPEGHGGYSYPGFSDTTVGLADPVKFHLAAVQGPPGGHFSLFRTIGGTPTVFMSTFDRLDENDVYPKPQGHHHMNWAFTRKGMWAVSLKVSAQRNPGNQPTAAGPTDTMRFFFAIGERAHWRASRFNAATVMEDAIAGDLADPDRDGWPNLHEYAFGGEPNTAARIPGAPVVETVVVGGETYAGISFHRRRDALAAELEYEVEWQSGLDPQAWESGGILHSQQIIDADWERVVFRDSSPLPGSPRFMRVRVSGL
jgi:surface-anchored protein